MAKLVAHGQELYRYFSTGRRGLIAYMADGVTLFRGIGGTWRVLARKKPEVGIADWTARKMDAKSALEPWKLKVTSLPTLSSLEKWERDGYCKTPTGQRVEPDGVGTDGVPSWLLVLGLM